MINLLERPMINRNRGKTMPIRIDVEALEAVKIAASFKGMSSMDYASQVLLEQANRDIEAGYKARAAAQAEAQSPKRRKKTDEGIAE
jgi:hypothetical protein